MANDDLPPLSMAAASPYSLEYSRTPDGRLQVDALYHEGDHSSVPHRAIRFARNMIYRAQFEHLDTLRVALGATDVVLQHAKLHGYTIEEALAEMPPEELLKRVLDGWTPKRK